MGALRSENAHRLEATGGLGVCGGALAPWDSDGYRFQIVKDGRQVRLYSRSGYDWTKRLPSFADAFQGPSPHAG